MIILLQDYKQIDNQADGHTQVQSECNCCYKASLRTQVLWNYSASCFQTDTCAPFSTIDFSKCNPRRGTQDAASVSSDQPTGVGKRCSQILSSTLIL